MRRSSIWFAPVATLSFACETGADELVAVDHTISGVVAAGTDAAVVSHTVPASMLPGESRAIEVIVQNSGAVLWDNSDYQYRRPTVDGLIWAPQRIFNQQVAGGETITFAFNVTAPEFEGTYTFDARMYLGRRTGGGFFGDTLSVTVDVSDRVAPDYDAVLLSHDVPSTLNPGERRRVNVIMQNAGRQPWLPEDIELRPKGTLRSTRSRPLDIIDSGSSTDLPSYVYAPAEFGRYTFEMRMGRQDGPRYLEFGPTVEVPITVGSVETLLSTVNTQDDFAIIDFTSTPTIATYECSLDGSAYEACFPPVGYRRLVEQIHTFSVRATIDNLVDETPASYSWTSGPPGPPIGGDGFIGGNEECDDANVLNGDGCSSVMQIEGGFSCIGEPSVCNLSSLVFNYCDDGHVEVNLGFPFQYFASEPAITRLYVATNGRLFFSANPYIFQFTNTPIPTVFGDNFLAWWWDDLYFCDAPAAFSYSVIGSPPNRYARMVMSDVGLYPGRNPARVLRAEVRVYETRNEVEVDYGTNTIPNLTAHMGAENSQGVATMINPFGCGSYCLSADWPAGTTYTFPQQP